jgi:hypothetical protein
MSSFKDIIEVKANVHIVGRERGKKIYDHRSHNIWVDLGREYLAKVISAADPSYTTRVNPALVKYIAVGIGSSEQTIDITTIYPTLDTDYPGQNIQTDTVLTVSQLERPVKILGTAGTGAALGDWMSLIAAPPTFTGAPGINTVHFTTLFDLTDINFPSNAYPAVPISECALMLSDQTLNRRSDEVYDYAAAPAYVGSLRQTLVAYHGFAPLTKTQAVTIQFTWDLQF